MPAWVVWLVSQYYSSCAQSMLIIKHLVHIMQAYELLKHLAMFKVLHS